MKSNTSVLLSVAVAILGFIVISVSGINIPGQYLFVIGALATGLAIQFIPTTKSTNTSEEANTADFTTATLYVGNLPYRANEMAIRTLFSEHGKVISVRLMKDKHTVNVVALVL